MEQVNSSCNLDYNTTIHLWPHANSFYMKYLKILDGCNSGWEEWSKSQGTFLFMKTDDLHEILNRYFNYEIMI